MSGHGSGGIVSTRPALKDSPTSQHAANALRPIAKCAASKHKLKERLEGLSIGELVELYKKFSLADDATAAAADLPGATHTHTRDKAMLSASARSAEDLRERFVKNHSPRLPLLLVRAIARHYTAEKSKNPLRRIVHTGAPMGTPCRPSLLFHTNRQSQHRLRSRAVCRCSWFLPMHQLTR